MAIPPGLQRLWQKFCWVDIELHWSTIYDPCRKLAWFLESRKILLRSYAIKKPNTTVLERDLQGPYTLLTRSTIDRQRMWAQFAGWLSCSFLCLRQSNNLRFSCLTPKPFARSCCLEPQTGFECFYAFGLWVPLILNITWFDWDILTADFRSC